MTTGLVQIGAVLVSWRTATDTAEPPVRAGASQQAFIAGLHGARRVRAATARALAVAAIDELAPGADPSMQNTCLRCGDAHGPLVAAHAPVRLSVSYAGDLVVVAAAPSSAVEALGVDAERADDPDAPLHDLTALFAPHRPPSTRGWTRIEAALKADGRGVRIAPDRVRADERNALVPGAAPVQLRDVPGLPAGVVATLAFRAAAESPQ